LGVLVLLFALFRIEINIGTAITAVVCLGLIVDDTIQIIYRKLILKKPFKDLNFSLLITSAILAIGFYIFAISSFEPVQIFGVLSATVFVVTFFSDILILNWLLKVDGNEKKH
jgi:predicted RND superfamily exporter protein